MRTTQREVAMTSSDTPGAQVPPSARPRTPVALIVPAYNAATTLDAALGSVASQTVPPAEVVVVNDGSSDGTAEIAARWSSVLPLQVVSLSDNRGPGQARNEGVRQTTAPVLTFLDADDFLLPDHLHVCLTRYESSRGVVAARGIRWRPGRGLEVGSSPRFTTPPPGRQLEWLVRWHSLGTYAVFPRSVFENVGGFDPTMEGVEDWDLWIRITRTGVELERSSKPTFLYRQHANNLSRSVENIGMAGLRMLDRLQDEILTEVERRDLAGALRESRARIALNIAYARLEAGDHRGARRFALQSLKGSWQIALRAVIVATAPGWWSKVRARRREQPANRE